MARRINHIVLIATLLASACVIEGASIATWINGLNHDIDSMIDRINQQVAVMNANIQKSVEETIQNLPRDKQGNIISTSGSSIISSIGNGSKIVTIIDGIARTITTGSQNGEPYVSDVVEKRIGDMLYYNATTTYPKTGVSETIAWKLNLAIPGSKPEIITDTKKDTEPDAKTDEK